MKKLSFPFLVFSIAMLSCKHKDYENAQLGNPAFSIHGLRNGESFSLAAGLDGLVQTSSIERNKYGVMEWRSNFVAASCPTCDPVFSIILNDSEGSTPENCANLELFNEPQLTFATEQSTSAFQLCELHLSDEETTADFDALEATQLGANSFAFEEEGIHEVSATLQLEGAPGQDDNNVEIRQSIYAGAHHHMSAPFLYEVLENEEEENQHIRVYFPEAHPELRATQWEINGVSYDDESIIIEIPDNEPFEIKLLYVNDAISLAGWYSLAFDNGFPADESSQEEEHISVAPFIVVEWETATPNYEKAIIEYRWNGKLYTSTTMLNSASEQFLELLSFTPFFPGIQSNNAISVHVQFDVILTEIGNESNVLSLENCSGTFGFTVPK